jgi:hypothetical protein
MRSVATRRIRHSIAMAAVGLFMAHAPHASAANSQAVCSPIADSPGYNSCSLTLGNAAFTSPTFGNDAEVFRLETGGGYLNLSKVDLVQTATGPGFTFDMGYARLTGGSGRYESPIDQISLYGLRALAEPGYQVDGITMRVQGTVSITGPASFSAAGANFSGTGEYALDVTRTLTPDDLSSGRVPSLTWSGNVPYASGPNGSASVFSMLNVVFNKVTVSASVSATPVPEPSTLALGSLAFVAAVFGARTRKARTAAL